MPSKPTGTSVTIEIPEIDERTIQVAVLGVRPVIINRVSQKAQRQLLFPNNDRKTPAGRAASLKHDPYEEFRASAYEMPDNDDPTLLAGRSSWFKVAMMEAALRLPGTRKTEIGQLVWVGGDLTPIYGIPEMYMDITRMADMAHTPDVPTRCIVPRWAALVTVSFMTPIINERSVVRLLAAAGKICGVGDFRPQKGKGTFGQFVLVDPDDETFRGIVATGGRTAQIAAMANPPAYDRETAEMLTWFDAERIRRGKTKEVTVNGRRHVAEVVAAEAV